MWAEVKADDSIGRIFSRPQPLTAEVDGDLINYPATVFRNADTLLSLGILPVRRVQVNAPEDTTGWSSTTEYVLGAGVVEERVTWTEDADADDKRAARDVREAKREVLGKRLALIDWMADKGMYSESQLGPADIAQFEADWLAGHQSQS